MKKLLIVLFVLLIGSSLFAVPDNYPFGVLVYPCEFYGECFGSEEDSNYISAIVGNSINANKSMCSICYNRQNEFMKWMLANDKLEPADLAYPVPENDYERIASQMDVDGYVVLRVKDFVYEPTNYKAYVTFTIKIYKLGVSEPIFQKDIEGKYSNSNGYSRKTTKENAYYHAFRNAGSKVYKEIAKFNAKKYKEVKVAHSKEERIEQLNKTLEEQNAEK